MSFVEADQMGAHANRVLVADEMADSANTLVAILQNHGLLARPAYDGRDALAIARSWDPDAAVLEISLPNVSGFDVARELRREYGPDIRLIAYSAWSAAEERLLAMEAGFDRYVVKPALPEHLLSCLGVEGAALVRRSIDLQVDQLRQQLELGTSLLRRAEHFYDQRSHLCDLVQRTIDINQTAIAKLPVSDALRWELRQAFHQLSIRVARLRAGDHPFTSH
jgi:CheY-like chemotaxis protein